MRDEDSGIVFGLQSAVCVLRGMGKACALPNCVRPWGNAIACRSVRGARLHGHLGQVTATGAVVFRIGDPRRATLRLVGGGGITSVRGRLEPLGLTTFGLGGHAVLFSGERRLSARIEPATAIGATGGADLAVALGTRAGLVGGWRLFMPRRFTADVRIDGFASSDEGFPEITPQEANAALDPAPLSIRPVTSSLYAGLQLRF